MSQNEIYLQEPRKSSYYHENIFAPYNSNNLIKNESDYQFSKTQPISYYTYRKKNEKNSILYKSPKDDESNYLKERYTKIRNENSELKRKLFDLEREYKIQKGELEEQVLFLRDENSNLQLQIQKAMEKQKVENSISDNIHNENLALINNINSLQNDSIILKDDITRKMADIEEKNKIINDLRNEKIVILNNEKYLKDQIENLINDKETLIQQIKELNETIGEKIAPKLKQNEDNLSKLQEQVENSRVENEKLKSDNLLLFNENNIQKNLIQILTKQNRKLLSEIKTIYDRDILFMDNMEKIGSENTNKYKNIFNKNSIEKENLFEEDMNILKDSQKYIDENTDIKNNNYNENYIENDSINDNDNEDIINDKIEEQKINNDINFNDIKNKRNINPPITNDYIIKRNKESFENEQKLNISNKNNSSFNDDINNKNIIKSKSKAKASNLNKINEKSFKKNNKLKNRNFNINSQSFTEGNISPNKINNIDEDIKIENKTVNQNINPKQLNLDIENEETLNKDYLFNTDGRINIKSKRYENFEKISDRLINNNDNDNLKQKEELNDTNQKFTNSNNFNIDENNNILIHSQAKSQLSDYVEDLDVIQYK